MPDLRSRPAQLLLLVVLIAALGAVWAGRSRQAEHAERLRLEAAVGAVPLYLPAPRVDLLPRDGRPVPLESYRGRVVFVNFWATWCGPCRAEMPSLIALQGQLDPADIAFVSVAEDDSWPPLDSYLQRSPLPFDVYRDQPPRIENRFETTSYPTSFLIDREGQAIYRFNGARDWNAPEVKALLALEGVRAR
ncbi:MAG: TlpA family protein disulfide reductase [Alphaproteobacteria bacterium]|nr:TlpA family protein disulfide reductase [Alphaproteobacteria bacterium]